MLFINAPTFAAQFDSQGNQQPKLDEIASYYRDVTLCKKYFMKLALYSKLIIQGRQFIKRGAQKVRCTLKQAERKHKLYFIKNMKQFKKVKLDVIKRRSTSIQSRIGQQYQYLARLQHRKKFRLFMAIKFYNQQQRVQRKLFLKIRDWWLRRVFKLFFKQKSLFLDQHSEVLAQFKQKKDYDLKVTAFQGWLQVVSQNILQTKLNLLADHFCLNTMGRSIFQFLTQLTKQTKSKIAKISFNPRRISIHSFFNQISNKCSNIKGIKQVQALLIKNKKVRLFCKLKKQSKFKRILFVKSNFSQQLIKARKTEVINKLKLMVLCSLVSSGARLYFQKITKNKCMRALQRLKIN